MKKKGKKIIGTGNKQSLRLMRICHIASEASPVAKVGGLADVTVALSRALIRQGHEVSLILPKYAALRTEGLKNLTLRKRGNTFFFDRQIYRFDIWSACLHEVKIFFIDPVSPYALFDRPEIYGYPDDYYRFAFFSAAALRFTSEHLPLTDIIHIHDWHTSLIAPIFREYYRDLLSCSIVLTIHNLSYQGKAPADILEWSDLNPEKYFRNEALKDSAEKNKVNLLKGGIIFSDAVTNVSTKYAEEIQFRENGKGLEKIILKNKKKLFGILNGIDDEIWNPKKDPALPEPYDIFSLSKKGVVKNALRKRLHMPLTNVPLVACICRLVPQKGPRMIQKAIEATLEMGGQFIFFGSGPIPRIQESFNKLKKKLADNPNVIFIFESYNEPLAHLIYAGADMFIIPSIFEPCGLTQLIALRYGTVPIARKTGGLANTVFDPNEAPPGKANGFTFTLPTSKEVKKVLKRAFVIRKEQPELWKQLMITGMSEDLGWNRSVLHYVKIYESLYTASGEARISSSS